MEASDVLELAWDKTIEVKEMDKTKEFEISFNAGLIIKVSNYNNKYRVTVRFRDDEITDLNDNRAQAEAQVDDWLEGWDFSKKSRETIAELLHCDYTTKLLKGTLRPTSTIRCFVS